MKPIKKVIHSCNAVHSIKVRLRRHKLHTVCEEARCPNLGECFSRGTATFMILGNICTRSCGFCGVKNLEHLNNFQRPTEGGTLNNVEREAIGLPFPDPDEPKSVARMVAELGLRHVVVTSVTRDDLPDEGAGQFAATINLIRHFWGRFPRKYSTDAILRRKIAQTRVNLESTRETSPKVMPKVMRRMVEVLTPDFHAREDCLRTVCEAEPDIYNHNIETVRRLTPLVRSHADYDRSLSVLKWVATNYPSIVPKSGFMLGLGERHEEVVETLHDLCKAGCKIVTIGQYLAPSKDKLPVAEYIRPEVFEEYKVIGEKLGIKHVFSGPFVRSSYMADSLPSFVRRG